MSKLSPIGRKVGPRSQRGYVPLLPDPELVISKPVIVVPPVPFGVRGQVRALVTGTRPGR